MLAYGIDYLRYKTPGAPDVLHIAARLPYIDIAPRWFHGCRFVDVTGRQLEIIRMFEDVSETAAEIAEVYPVHRVDVFVDVLGDILADVKSSGTKISNGGRVETIYSIHLKQRGNVRAFGRAYDAQAAGHYDMPVTRLECEFKLELARALLNTRGWCVNPVALMLQHIKAMFGVTIVIENVEPIDLNAPRRKLEHNRERFYRRYGRSIYNDVEKMGVQGFQEYVLQCVQNAQGGNDSESKGEIPEKQARDLVSLE